MREENLVAERFTITTDQEIARWIGDSDPTTRRLIEGILEKEEEHADVSWCPPVGLKCGGSAI